MFNNTNNNTAPTYNNEMHLGKTFDPEAPAVPVSDDARAPDLFAPGQPNVQTNSPSRRADRSDRASFSPVGLPPQNRHNDTSIPFTSGDGTDPTQVDHNRNLATYFNKDLPKTPLTPPAQIGDNVSHDSSLAATNTAPTDLAGRNFDGHHSGFNSPTTNNYDPGLTSHLPVTNIRLADTQAHDAQTHGTTHHHNSHHTLPHESESAILADTTIAPLDDTPPQIESNPRAPHLSHGGAHQARDVLYDPSERERNRVEAEHIPNTFDTKTDSIDFDPRIHAQGMPNEPKVTHGRMDVFKGQMKKIAGAIQGDDDKFIEGEELKQRGKREIEIAKVIKEATE